VTEFSRSALFSAIAVIDANPRADTDPQGVYNALQTAGDPVSDACSDVVVALRLNSLGIDVSQEPEYASLCKVLLVFGYQFSALLLDLPPRHDINEIDCKVDELFENWEPIGWPIPREWFDPVPGPDDDWADSADEFVIFEKRERGWMPHKEFSLPVGWCVRGLTESILKSAGVMLESTDEVFDDRMAMGLLWFNDGIVLAAADWHLHTQGLR